MPTYYKVLGGPTGRDPVHGGRGRWRARGWMPAVIPRPCVSGYHVCTLAQLPAWLVSDGAVWEVETRGQHIEADDKTVVAQARLVRRLAWSPQIAALFAADCAERVLPLFEDKYPDDTRPRAAITAARQWARGEIDTAAWACASAAAWDAAWDAAALDAAWADQWAAESQWQADRLRQYLYGEVTP